MHDITKLLHDARRGERKSEDLLLERIYSELHHLAVRFLSAERPDHTLQPSALVNEAYLKLFGKKSTDWENRRTSTSRPPGPCAASWWIMRARSRP